MKKVYVGLDMGSTVCATVAICARGRELNKSVFKTSERNLIETMEKVPGEVHVMLEEGEMSGWVYRALVNRVKRVVVSDPKQNAWIAKDPVKSDPVDALKLADLLRLGRYREVFHHREEEMEAFKKAVQLHEDMGKKVRALKNQLKAKLRREGVICKDLSVYTPAGLEKALKKVESKTVKLVIRHNFNLLKQIILAKKEAEKMVKALSQRYPIVKALQKVPGIGPTNSARFVAYLQTPHRFGRRNQVWTYSALGLSDRSSDGKPLGRKHLNRSGNAALKDVSRRAFEAAMLRKGDNLFKRTYQRTLKNTQDKTHARLTTQRKIISVLWAMWRNGTEYNDDVDGHRA